MALIADFSEMLSGSNVLLCGLVLVIAVLMLRAQRHLGRRQNTVVRRPVRASSKRPVSPAPTGTPEQLQRWEVELYELARELTGRIDSKMSALQALIQAADERIQRLEATITDRTSLAATTGLPSQQVSSRSPRADEDTIRNHILSSRIDKTADGSAGNVPRAVDAGSAHTQADALAAARMSMPDKAAPLAPKPAAQRDHRQIYALADAGVPMSAIAAQVGSPVGEVELVLSLRNSR